MADLDRFLPAIAAGDPDAFGRWVADAELRLRASLHGFARGVDVESVVQESLLRVWQVAPRVETDGRGDSLLRLAIRIARNLAISELRRNRQDPTADDELERLVDHENPGPPAEPVFDPLLRDKIERCRGKLPKRPAQALAARLEARGGQPDQVLAEGLGMLLNTFLQNFTRARRFLLECLKRHGVDIETELP